MQRFLTVLGVALGLSLACGEPGAAPLDLAPLDGGLTDAAPLDAGVEAAGDDMSAPDASMEDGGTGSAARILFVGNSYTFYNDLPELYATTTGLAPAPEVEERCAHVRAIRGTPCRRRTRGARRRARRRCRRD